MALSYTKTVTTSGCLIACTALAGGALLGLGLSGGHLGIFGGHTWEVITGSSLMGVAVIGGITSAVYFNSLKDVDTVKEALAKDSRIRIWAFARRNGEKIMVTKNSGREVHTHELNQSPIEMEWIKNIQNVYYKRVLIL